MAAATGANQVSQIDNPEYLNPAQDKKQKLDPSVVSSWKGNSPSYLAIIQALLDKLPEEDKNAIHASFEGE